MTSITLSQHRVNVVAPNENKISPGERERAWLLAEGLRSCTSGYRAGSPSAAADGQAASWLANDDVTIGALNNRPQLRLLGRRNLEFVERLLQVIHESIPLFGRDVQVLMRVAHGAPRVFLRATGRPANHFGDVILEAGWRHLVVGFVHGGVCIEAGVGHDAVDEFIDDRGDAERAAEALVETGLGLLLV